MIIIEKQNLNVGTNEIVSTSLSGAQTKAATFRVLPALTVSLYDTFYGLQFNTVVYKISEFPAFRNIGNNTAVDPQGKINGLILVDDENPDYSRVIGLINLFVSETLKKIEIQTGLKFYFDPTATAYAPNGFANQASDYLYRFILKYGYSPLDNTPAIPPNFIQNNIENNFGLVLMFGSTNDDQKINYGPSQNEGVEVNASENVYYLPAGAKYILITNTKENSLDGAAYTIDPFNIKGLGSEYLFHGNESFPNGVFELKTSGENTFPAFVFVNFSESINLLGIY